jgi:hypothetical protein
LCFDAEVFHAESRQAASRVRVVVEATAQASTANVRILSSALVDEPVVTVYLRAGCGPKTTRRYVLLADLPSEMAGSSLAARVSPIVALPSTQTGLTRAASASASASNSASTGKAKTARTPKRTGRPELVDQRPELKTAIASSNRAPSEEKNKTGRLPGRSRLTLDPLELLSDRVADIDTYMTFTSPEDALRSMKTMQTLEGDVKVLRALSAKNEASLVDLKARLQKAELERFPGGVIYALVALVLACLAAVAFLWSRQRRVHADGGNWWSGAVATPVALPIELGPSPEPPATYKGLSDEFVSKSVPKTALTQVSDDTGPPSEMGVNLMEMSESAFDNLMQSGDTHASNQKLPLAPSIAATAQTTSAIGFNSEAMLDIRQQAEFFVSLGQTDRAVRILRKQIETSGESNPFVYLDLLSLLHSLGLKADFRLLREDFNLLFNGRVPEFAFFKEEGQGLESYPDGLSRITALWPAPEVLHVMEAYIFQDPRLANNPSFDLAAFRDLLLLHALAQNVLASHANGIEPEIGAAPGSVARAGEDEQSRRGLDLDLSDLTGQGLVSDPLRVGEVDIPLFMPGEHKVEGQAMDAGRPLDSGNLMKFDLPLASRQPEVTGSVSGRRTVPVELKRIVRLKD